MQLISICQQFDLRITAVDLKRTNKKAPVRKQGPMEIRVVKEPYGIYLRKV
jgi:hypothetical protein